MRRNILIALYEAATTHQQTAAAKIFLEATSANKEAVDDPLNWINTEFNTPIWNQSDKDFYSKLPFEKPRKPARPEIKIHEDETPIAEEEILTPEELARQERAWKNRHSPATITKEINRFHNPPNEES
jgi:hypothetical protein